MKVELIEGNHTYRTEDGLTRPGVNEILQAHGIIDFSMVKEEILAPAIEFGKHVHEATEFDDKGTLNKDTLDPGLRPCVEAWAKFVKDYKVEMIAIEPRLYSVKYDFAGTPDRIAKSKLGYIIPDLKTGSSVNPAWGLTTAAYEILARENKLIPANAKVKRLIVRLKGGTYGIKKLDSVMDQYDFIACVKVYHLKKRFGGI